MSVPDIVERTLEGEEIVTRVSLGSDDELLVTPSRTLIYRSDGLLSDESVEEYPHDAERLQVSEGRRKTRIGLEYAIGGTKEFTVAAGKAEAVIHPVVAGVLNGNGITDAGESVVQTFRFSELTVIVTSNRLVKHIGEAVWDTDFEQYHFEDVTQLSFEDGSVATQIVMVVDGRPQRIKAPNEHATELRERLERALFAYHGVDSLAAFNALADDGEDEAADEGPATAFESVDALETGASSTDTAQTNDDPIAGIGDDSSAEGDVLAASHSGAETDTTTARSVASPEEGGRPSAGSSRNADGADGGSDGASGSDSAFAESGFESATATDAALLERIERLEATVERQSALLERQHDLLETLIEELRAGR